MEIKQYIIKQAVDINRHLNYEMRMCFQEDGIHIKTVDSGHTELLITFIPKTSCDEYNLTKTGELEIGIDIEKLRDFLRIFKKNDIFSIDYDLESNRLIIKQGYLTRTMGVLDTAGMPDPKVPDLNLRNRIFVDSKLFYEKLKETIYDMVEHEDIEEVIITDSKTGKIDFEYIDVVEKKYERVYDKAYLTVTRDNIVLENSAPSWDEDKDRKLKVFISCVDIKIMASTNAVTRFDSGILFKQLNDYRKYWKHINVETDYYHPVRITGDDGFVQFEYLLAPCMPDEEQIDREKFENAQKETAVKKEIKPEPEIKEEVKTDVEHETFREELEEDREKFEEDRDLDPSEQKDDWEPVKEEIEREQVANDIKSVVRPICKTKRQPYNKYQWSQDMEFIKDQLEKHRLNKETERDKVKKTVEYKGFVFFINIPKTETELSYIKIKNKDGSQIIQHVLPDGYVLIAWYKWNGNGWIAQTVKRAI